MAAASTSSSPTMRTRSPRSTCAFGHGRMANVWMHNGFLQVEGEKMSKSLGNFVTIRDLLETRHLRRAALAGRGLRLAMLRTHYRQPIDWTVKALEESCEDAARLGAVRRPRAKWGWGPSRRAPHPVIAALSDDLNTPARHAPSSSALAQAVQGRGTTCRDAVAALALAGVPGRAQLARPGCRGTRCRRRAAGHRRAPRSPSASPRARPGTGPSPTGSATRLVAMGIQLMDAKDPITGDQHDWEVKR